MTVILSSGKHSVTAVSASFGLHRSTLYKSTKQRTHVKIDEHTILDMVHDIRSRHPRMGARKMLSILKEPLSDWDIEIGRDAFFDLLRSHDLLIQRRKKGPLTTNSQHGHRHYPNLVKSLDIAAPNEVWVSDLTYIRIGSDFAYLSLITDRYSRKIVGWELHKTLAASGCLIALRMACAQLPSGHTPIHHSDRGVQYCCDAYIAELSAHLLGISMTEDNHCYENGCAERINGILKYEYALRARFESFEEALQACRQAIFLYNNERPHLCLNYATPATIHGQAA